MNPELEIVSHEYWQQNAERLLYSAHALIEKLRTIQDDQDLQIDVFTWNSNMRSLLEANYMLLGYAAENSIKGYSIYKFTCSHGHPISSDLQYLLKNVWKVRRGHDIIEIAINAGLHLSGQEKEILTKLREHSIWKGRYHIPITTSEIKESILPGEKDKYTPADRQLITDLIRRIGIEVRQ